MGAAIGVELRPRRARRGREAHRAETERREREFIMFVIVYIRSSVAFNSFQRAVHFRKDSVRRHRPSTKSIRPTSAFRWANCTALLAGILLATSELATVPRATCEAQVNMVSLLG